jgi:hypothetical protein
MLKTISLTLVFLIPFRLGYAQIAFTSLVTDGPAAEYRNKLALFGQFVGKWEFQGFEYPANGTRVTDKGSIEFAWVLGGRAIQDVWIESERSDGAVKTYGTTIRFYDPKIDAWQILWIDPPTGHVQALIGRRDGDRIVLEGKRPDGVSIRWIFSEIKADSFHWSGEELVAGQWRLAEECFPHRVGPTPH